MFKLKVLLELLKPKLLKLKLLKSDLLKVGLIIPILGAVPGIVFAESTNKSVAEPILQERAQLTSKQLTSQQSTSQPEVESITPKSSSSIAVESKNNASQTNMTKKEHILLLLNNMVKAAKDDDFESYMVVIEPTRVRSYRYRHAKVAGKQYAQLLNLAGARQEILQRGDTISYFGASYQPFSLEGHRIIDAFPPVMFSDFNKLKKYYDFIYAGKDRIANRTANVIKIFPKDDFRYQYIVWIDTKTNLLLQSELLNREGQSLQQVGVIRLFLSNEIERLANVLNKINLPPTLSMDKSVDTSKATWNTSWLPKGFTSTRENTYMTALGNVESKIYSDGLFSFSLYVNNVEEQLPENFWQQGGNTIYTEVRDGKEITFIGQLPLVTAKQIVQDVIFKTQ